MRFLLRLFVAAILCFAAFYSDAMAQEQPNIIVILADDLGYSDLGCFGGEINTPTLDSLAENGLRCTQMYSTARCCPSRASSADRSLPASSGCRPHGLQELGRRI